MWCFNFKSPKEVIEITLEVAPSIYIKYITKKKKTAKGRYAKQFSVTPFNILYFPHGSAPSLPRR